MTTDYDNEIADHTIPRPKTAKYSMKNKTDIFVFGKYKGMSIRIIIDKDPEYILWLAEKGIVDFSQEILDNAEDEAMSNYPPEEYFWQPD